MTWLIDKDHKDRLLAEMAGEYDLARERAVALTPAYDAFRRDHGASAQILFQQLVGAAVHYASSVAGDDTAKWLMAMRSAAFQLQEATVLISASMKDALREPWTPAAVALVAYDVAEQARGTWSDTPVTTEQLKTQWPAAIAAATAGFVSLDQADAERVKAIDVTLEEAGEDLTAQHLHTHDEELLERVGAMVSDEADWDGEVVTTLIDSHRDLIKVLSDLGAWQIAAERHRQLTGEGYDPLHDDGYVDGQLAAAAWCYLGQIFNQDDSTPAEWPWDAKHWKPGPPTRNLEKAGALIAAEITRRQRAHDAFLALVVEACVAGGANRDHAAGEVAQAVPDFLKEEGIEVGHPDRDWGVSGAANLADELVLRHLEGQADG